MWLTFIAIGASAFTGSAMTRTFDDPAQVIATGRLEVQAPRD
jgi:hypothetical protein